MNEQVVFAVARPRGQAGSVGVAGFGEVGPVAHHLFAQLAILGPPESAGAGVERAEDVLDVVRVEGKGFQVVFADRRGQLQVITIDGRVA